MRKLAPSKNSPRSSVSGIFTTITLQKSAFALGRVRTIGLFKTYVPTGGSPNYAISTNAVFTYTIFHHNYFAVKCFCTWTRADYRVTHNLQRD